MKNILNSVHSEFEGRVFTEGKKIIIDAKPHVMRKIRSLFSDYSNRGQGDYTHRILSLSLTLSNCKDIKWISERYIFDISLENQNLLEKKSLEYDKNLVDIKKALTNNKLLISKSDLEFNCKLRGYQIIFNNYANASMRMLLADKMGVGKTLQALSLLIKKERLPALIILPPSITIQWLKVINEVLPTAKVYYTKDGKAKEISGDIDIVVTTYSRISKWNDEFDRMNFKTIILDEVQELRHLKTQKREACIALTSNCDMNIGLSGTPFYNLGSELWSVLDVISPGSLGQREEFLYDWCDVNGSVKDPISLNSHLKDMGLLLRRTPEELGLNFGKVNKIPYLIQSDIKSLKAEKNILKKLALSVVNPDFENNNMEGQNFDYKLRQATGIAKAKAVADFAKMILEEEDKVIISGWHRGFYEILLQELKEYNPTMRTGSESSDKQKNDQLEEFINGDSRIYIVSHKITAGLDGLQKVCHTLIHGELALSPHIHDQLNTRLDRDGQEKTVNAYYLMVNDGSDPVVSEKLNLKRSQHEGIIEGKNADIQKLFSQASSINTVEMARRYLESIGEKIPDQVKIKGLQAELSSFLRLHSYTQQDEDSLQTKLFELLNGEFPKYDIQREVKIGKRSRLDFLVKSKSENIIIECKINSKNKRDVYRQLKKYTEEELNVTGIILLAPWGGISNFDINGIPVSIVDLSLNSL